MRESSSEGGAATGRDPRYSPEPEDALGFTRRNDRAYTVFAGLYDAAVRRLPVWKTWLARALPHIAGPRVLELSFGTGLLLTRYAGEVEAHGIDYNRAMVRVARRNLARAGLSARLLQANVEALPYPDGCFDTLVNTMAFSGYPDARRALSEMRRVLRPGGRLILIDVGYPADGNRPGVLATRLWKLSGDLIRDTAGLLREQGFETHDEEIGGSGSVHLYRATRAADSPA